MMITACSLPLSHAEMAVLKLITLEQVLLTTCCPCRTLRWPNRSCCVMALFPTFFGTTFTHERQYIHRDVIV
eukprot:7319700-Karenia_brevis.AAC.1